MNAIQKMQQEGTLKMYLEDVIKYRERRCPHKYDLDSKCEGNHVLCWEHALTKDYEGVND